MTLKSTNKMNHLEEMLDSVSHHYETKRLTMIFVHSLESEKKEESLLLLLLTLIMLG